MSAKKFFAALNEVLNQLETTQEGNIHTAATWVAEAIMADRFGVLFGSGHSFIPTMDTYPRIGSFPGWLPIHEVATSYVAQMSGDTGLRQSLFLEKVEGYGKVLLANYKLDPRDVMIVISNSGCNTIGVEIAMEAKKMGLKTVGITSVTHSQASTSFHSSGKRLMEVVDLVIDTHVPKGDALVEVSGLPSKVASASTIAGCVVMQSLAAEVASIFSEHGYQTPVFPSHNDKLSHDETASQIQAMYSEDARRVKNVLQ